jgi:hypothetical protein
MTFNAETPSAGKGNFPASIDFCEARKLIANRLKRFDPESSAVMAEYVLRYASITRPTAVQLYRTYQADIYRRNDAAEARLPLLSMHLFRSAIDCLEPGSVLASRYGSATAKKYRQLGSLPRRRRSMSDVARTQSQPWEGTPASRVLIDGSHRQNDMVGQTRTMSKATGPTEDRASFGPLGVDHINWAFARLLQDFITRLEVKQFLGERGLPDNASSAKLLRTYWDEIQARSMKSHRAIPRLYFPHISVRRLNRYVKAYRTCGNHPLALVPARQWRKRRADWDPHVLAITLMQSIELPHPKARCGQRSVAFAAAQMVRFSGLVGIKPSAIYRKYELAVAVENEIRAKDGALPLTVFDRPFVERLLKWFPQLANASTATFNASEVRLHA